ncbi:MAG: alpha/beta hydrolase [Pirellulales bacterium]
MSLRLLNYFARLCLAVCIICLQVSTSSLAAPLQQIGLSSESSDIDLLTARLKMQQAPVRIAAARRLAEMGKQAKKSQDALIQCLTDANNDVRVVSCYALARVSDDVEKAIAALIPLLSDTNEHVRYSAQWSVAQLVVELTTSVRDEVSRKQVLELLGKVVAAFRASDHQSRHLNTVESVIAALSSQVSNERTTQDELSKESLDAEQLVAGLYEPNDIMSRLLIVRRLQNSQKFPSSIRQRVLIVESTNLDSGLLDYAVQRWGSLAQAELASILSQYDTETELPEFLVALIGQIQPTEVGMLTRLKNWSRDNRLPIEIRQACLTAISKSKFDQAGSVEWLSLMLSEPDLQVVAADAIAELGPLAASVQTQLMSALMQSRDESFQFSGIAAIASIAPESSIASQFIIQWLRVSPDDSSIVPQLLDACEEFGPLSQSAIPLVQKHLKHADPQVRVSALRALRGMPQFAGVAMPEMLAILCNPHEQISIKNRTARVIAKMGPDAVRQVLTAITSNNNPAVQTDLLHALAVMGPVAAEGLALCSNVIDNPNAPISMRVAAANVIGSVGKSAHALAPKLLAHCNGGEDDTLFSSCLLAAARVNPGQSLSTAQTCLVNRSRVIRASAAYAACLAGESRAGFESLLDMLVEDESDLVIKEALEELSDHFANWFVDEAESTDRTDIQRLSCCELASQMDNPDWTRLMQLVDDPSLGQQFADRLTWYWHPEIANQLGEHLPEVETLLEVFQSNLLSLQGRARLASLLLPDGLGAGDEDGQWSGIALSREASVELLQRSQVSNEVAETSNEELMPEPIVDSLVPNPKRSIPAREAAPTPSASATMPAAPAPTTPTVPKPITIEDLASGSSTEPSIKEVEVFYGTNRQRDSGAGNMREIVMAILVTTIGSVVTLMILALVSFYRGGKLSGLFALLGMLVFGSVGVFTAQKLTNHPVQSMVAYNHQVSDHVEYGKCKVTIPPIHQPGVVEAPMLLKGQLIADPNKHVMLANVSELSQDQFMEDLKYTQAKKGKNLLVFIHGYNVSFEDAAKRTAQMAFDVDFPGAPIFYSWPSQADWYGYDSDRKRIERSVSQIRTFLEDLAAKSGATSINIVAHSMGNVGLTSALKEIAAPNKGPIFNQIVLAAPDVDTEVFKRDIAPFIVSKAKRTTIYTSKTDLALIASRYFNSGARLGDSGAEVISYPGIDTIDATAVDSSLLGHSYYGSNITVLTDVGHLLRGEPLAQRVYLRPIRDGQTSYWTFDPVMLSNSPLELPIKK